MIKAIIKKEWLKIKYLVLFLFLISISVLIHFYINLDFLFKTVEPESMMWYRFSSLEQKPYDYLAYLFYLISITISLFQFIPEKVKNRVKMIIHFPISISKSIFLHLLVGIIYIFILSLFISFFTTYILSFYYPSEIITIALKDFFFYFLGSLILYFGVSSAIIEKNSLVSIIKLSLSILFIFIFHKNIFDTNDLLWIFISFFMIMLVLDSFYSIKEQRVNTISFKFLTISSMVIVGYFATTSYKEEFKKEFNKYYIFYSPILKEFVYQKNFGEHNFEYGIKEKKTFDRETYESYLPFVYWRNLDIQKKLPIIIDNETFDKELIRDSRLSFSFKPEFLKEQELKLYPFLNPNSKIGMIKFPEEVLIFEDKQITAYNFDEKFDKKLSEELASLTKKHKVSFPIKKVWGKFTNLKPFDLGYFFVDSKKRLFRLNRADDITYLNEISYPKEIELAYIRISENRQKQFAGYAISKNSDFYLLDYHSFEFKKIDLKEFDYKKMRLQLISNPKYYLIRYTDEENYFVSLFDKKLNKLEEEVFK